MRLLSAFRISLLALTSLIIFSCSNKTETFVTDKLSDYLPLQTGKYITYRLDSLVFTNFGTVAVTRRYQMRQVVDAQLTDNLGRPSYRVYTFIRDSAGTLPWTASGTYFVTPLSSQIELTEDNLRVIKLHLPIREGYEWNGNSYLSDNPYSSIYVFNNDEDIQSWDFTYDTFEPAASYRGNNYTNVYTVLEQDESGNATSPNPPVTDPAQYGFYTKSLEKYSKDIGLIYRKYVLWEYQTNPTIHYTGFGVTMWMIDHN
jgi:hypothetical protein